MDSEYITMTRTYKIKKVPIHVVAWFNRHFPLIDGYTYEYYWYTGMDGKTYGCNVSKDGKFWHNATQATEEWFIKQFGIDNGLDNG